MELIKWKYAYFVQMLCSLTGSLSIFCASVSFGWTSPMLPRLMADDSPMHLTSSQGSDLVSCMLLGAMLSPIPMAWIMDRYGRKAAILLLAVPQIIAWSLLSNTQSVLLWYISRVLSGLSYGACYSVLPVYISEIASANIRGFVGAIFTVQLKCGLLFAYAVGPVISMPVLSYIALGMNVLFIVTFVWMPETPQFYLSKGNRVDALKSLNTLRDHSELVPLELHEMQVSVGLSKDYKGSWTEMVRNRTNRKALTLVNVIGATIQLCGSQAIICNSEMLFRCFTGGGLNPASANIILGCSQVFAACVASSVLDFFGRRPLLLGTYIVTGLANSILAGYFLAHRLGYDLSSLGWLPMIALIVFISFYTIGMSSVFSVLVGEIFPKQVRAKAVAVSVVVSAMIGAFVTKLFQVVSDELGKEYAFSMFAVCTFGALVYLWRKMPETKGLALDEVHRMFNR